MKRFEFDRSLLRHDLMLPLAMAVVGVGVLFTSYVWSISERRELAGHEQQLADLDTRRLGLADRVQSRQRYAERFRHLQATGVTRDGQRLAWAQAFSDSAMKLRLPYLRYVVLPQRAWNVVSSDADGSAPVMVTTVDLQAGLVHELDLLRMIDMLRAAPGLLEVAGCALERTDADSVPGPHHANLSASCQLRWFTIPLHEVNAVAEAGA